MKSRARTLRIVLFAVLALLALSELLLSNLGTLFGDLAGAAQMMGLSLDAERARLFVLIALDAVAGVGALMALYGIVAGNAAVGRPGVGLCAFGFAAYGLYQLVAAQTQLAAGLRLPITIVGLVYIGLGALAWFGGRGAFASRAR